MLDVTPPAVMDAPPWLDTAVSWALLERTAAGTASETLRLCRPARIVAFGPALHVLGEVGQPLRMHYGQPLRRLCCPTSSS